MDAEEILHETVAIARRAGVVLDGWLGRLEGVEFKGEVDLVTAADRASEAYLVEALGRLLPEAAILAEEGSGRDAASVWRWIVDPLDGTTNFAHGYPVYCVSIALEDADGMVLGVVHDPTRAETFTARRGAGAARNGEPIRTGRRATVGEALLVTGFPYDIRTSPRTNLPQFAAFARRARGVRRSGSAALDLCYVAAGRCDGFWEEKLSPWDLAAGALIAGEAGATVTGYHGDPLRLDQGHVVAANPVLHRAMVNLLATVEGEASLPPLGPRR